MWGRRLAIVLWLALVFVTWNVVFDRAVWLAAADFTRENVERYERGAPVPTINEAYRPAVAQAALYASAWAGGVLVAGALAINAAGRLRRGNVLP
jgi:hypothetical protein